MGKLKKRMKVGERSSFKNKRGRLITMERVAMSGFPQYKVVKNKPGSKANVKVSKISNRQHARNVHQRRSKGAKSTDESKTAKKMYILASKDNVENWKDNKETTDIWRIDSKKKRKKKD